MATCVDAFDHPVKTGLLMARDEFCRWSASESRDLMLWFVNGEVWIAGLRSSPCHELAFGAFQQLMLSVNRCKFVGLFRCHEYALLALWSFRCEGISNAGNRTRAAMDLNRFCSNCIERVWVQSSATASNNPCSV
jgi:hypothetical protein